MDRRDVLCWLSAGAAGSCVQLVPGQSPSA